MRGVTSRASQPRAVVEAAALSHRQPTLTAVEGVRFCALRDPGGRPQPPVSLFPRDPCNSPAEQPGQRQHARFPGEETGSKATWSVEEHRPSYLRIHIPHTPQRSPLVSGACRGPESERNTVSSLGEAARTREPPLLSDSSHQPTLPLSPDAHPCMWGHSS